MRISCISKLLCHLSGCLRELEDTLMTPDCFLHKRLV